MRPIKDKIREISGKRKIAARILCLLLSISLWAIISSTKIGKVTFKCQVEIKNLAQNAVISDMARKYLPVTFEGKKENIKNVSSKNVRLYVDLKNASNGVLKKYKVEIDKQEIPEGVSVSLPVKKIKILVDRKLQKKVRVIANITGSPSKGYMAGRVSITPPNVFIVGPVSEVEKVEVLQTDEIDIEGSVSTVIKTININREGLKNIYLNETNVKIIVPITEYKRLREIEIPISLKNIDDNFNYNMNVSKIKVYFKGNEGVDVKDDDEINTEMVEAFIDASKANLKLFSGEHKADFINFELPVSIGLKRTDGKVDIVFYNPEKIAVRISPKE